MARIEERHKQAAAEMVSRAQFGRSVDRPSGLDILPLAASYRVACRIHTPHGPEPTALQPIAIVGGEADARALAALILAEAEAQVEEVKGMVRDGEVPEGVSCFADLHDHFDANCLGMGEGAEVFKPHPLVGQGVGDLSEAWCGVLNCAHNAVDAMIRGGGLRGLAQAAPRR